MTVKLAILIPDLRGGGVERVCLVIAREFARCGHQVEVVLMRLGGELLHEEEEHRRVVSRCLAHAPSGAYRAAEG